MRETDTLAPETDTSAPAEGRGELAQRLAEAAAGLRGAGEKLAAGLRPELEALLDARLRTSGPLHLHEVGQIVQQHWQRLVGPEGDEPASAAGLGAPPDTSSPNASWSGAEGAEAVAKGPLYRCHAEQSSAVMRRLVRELAMRTNPEGPASRSLQALDALERLEPRLAQVAELVWFAGLGNETIATVVGDGPLEVARLRLKAHAFLVAAAATAGATTSASKRA